jgi:hypothetical protein
MVGGSKMFVKLTNAETKEGNEYINAGQIGKIQIINRRDPIGVGVKYYVQSNFTNGVLASLRGPFLTYEEAQAALTDTANLFESAIKD